jgi:hypothetical protein
VENDDGSFSGDDGGSSGDNGGFSGDEEGEIEFGHDNVDGFGFGDDVSGPRNDFGEGSEHGDDSEDKTPSTDEDHANPANDGFEDTDADATAVQGYGNELLRVPLKRSQLPYSDNESVNNQPTTSKKKRLVSFYILTKRYQKHTNTK